MNDSSNLKAISFWTLLAWLSALVACAGSLYLTVRMKLEPCPLCYYQRTFALAIGGLMTIGLLTPGARRAPLSLLVLPLAIAAVGIAGWHVYLEWAGKLECPKGIEDIGTAPQQALAALAVVTLFLLFDTITQWRRGFTGFGGFLAALCLGGLIVYGCLKSVPPMKSPTSPYDDSPLVKCRPPYTAPAE